MKEEKSRKQQLLETIPTHGVDGRGRNDRLRQIQRMLMWQGFSERELDFLEKEIQVLSSYRRKKKGEAANVAANTGRRP